MPGISMMVYASESYIFGIMIRVCITHHVEGTMFKLHMCSTVGYSYMHMQFPCKKVSTRTCVRYLDYYASLPVTTTTIGRRRKHTSSPRSFPSLSCVLKVPSSAHLSQMASSALAKSRAGGRELMVPGWLVSVVWELLLVASWLPVPEWHVLVLRSNTS